MESGKVWDTVMFGKLVGGLIKLPDCGTCSVMFGENDGGWEHVSVSPKHKYKIPTKSIAKRYSVLEYLMKFQMNNSR